MPLDPEILPNNTQEIFHFELLDPEILTNNTQNLFSEKMDPKTVLHFLGHELREATYSYALLSRITPKDRKIGCTISSTTVYVCRRKMQNRRKIGSNQLHSIF